VADGRSLNLPDKGISMDSHLSQKDELLKVLVEALRSSLGDAGFVVIDHWPDDPAAIGIASPVNPGVLAYVSASSGADEPYFVSLEFPPQGDWADQPYTPLEDRDVCQLDEVMDIVSRHLASVPSTGSR